MPPCSFLIRNREPFMEPGLIGGGELEEIYRVLNGNPSLQGELQRLERIPGRQAGMGRSVFRVSSMPRNRRREILSELERIARNNGHHKNLPALIKAWREAGGDGANTP